MSREVALNTARVEGKSNGSMKRFVRLSFAVVAVPLVTASCKPAPPSLAGEWEGTVVGKNLTKLQDLMYNGLGRFKLKVGADGHFKLSSGTSQVFEGEIKQSGDALSLVKESFNGKRGPDMDKELLSSSVQFEVGSKPMAAVFDAKIGKLTVSSDKNPDFQIEFVRAVPPSAKGPSTVSSAEAKLVGKYVSILNQPEPTSSGPPAELHLLVDNTYVMNLIGVPTKGTWKLEKGHLVLKDSDSKDPNDPKEHFILEVGPKGDLVDHRKDQFALPFRFVKR